jgi:GH25 family lysozyme M1 (1,4-beta-N-acetylmuramidase)
VIHRTYEGYAGRYLRNYQPRTTIHSVVNRLVSKPATFKPAAAFLGAGNWADVSFYQGRINWLVMKSKASKVIIRAGQNEWVDSRFRDNWPQSKQAGFFRECYFFYDGRVSPSAQLITLKSALAGDMPEGAIWVDWERSYSGGHEGLRNVVAFMQAIEAAFPGVDVGLYTGYYFFRENSNPIWNAAQYRYLAERKLWLAFYADPSDVLVPPPWTKPHYHQWGTPPVGKEWGVETIEIDLNTDGLGVADPQPEPTGAIMRGVVKSGFTLAVRDVAGASLGTSLRAGDSVNGTVTNGRIYFGTMIYRANGEVTVLHRDGNAAVSDPVTGTEWMTLTDDTPPAPADTFRLSVHMVLTAEVNGREYSKVIDLNELLDLVE